MLALPVPLPYKLWRNGSQFYSVQFSEHSARLVWLYALSQAQSSAWSAVYCKIQNNVAEFLCTLSVLSSTKTGMAPGRLLALPPLLLSAFLPWMNASIQP